MGTKHTLLAGALLAAALCLFAPAVGAEDNKTVGSWPDDGYTVTIPSTVAFAEGDKTQKLEITGTLGKYRTLDVTVASANGYALKYASDPTNNALPSLNYTLKSADTTQNFDSETTGKNTLSYTTDATERNPISTTLNAEITTPLDTATMSGSYTDNLTFTFDCKKRTQECEITVKYESMDTTATGEITKRERNSQWENETYTFKETLNLGEEHTFELEELFDKNSSVKYAVTSKDDTENKKAWEFGKKAMLDPTTHQYTTRTYSITPTPDKTNYEIKVYRKMVWLDLNYIIYDSEDKTNPLKYKNIKYGAEYGDKNIAMMEITVNTETKNDKRDYWGMHPYGSTFTMSNIRNGNVEDFKNYAIYGYYLGHLSTDLTNNSDVYIFAESEAKTTGSQTLKDVYCSTSKEYGGDYSEAVYIILRPYTVTIKYETMASTKAISSGSTHKRNSVFPETGNEVIKEIAWDTDGTYTWTNQKYTEEKGYWKDATYTIEKKDDKYDYEIGVLRKMYALDLNVSERVLQADGTYIMNTFGSKKPRVEEWGKVDAIIVNKNQRYDGQGAGLHDYFTAHPYGSTFSMTGIQIDTQYEIVGYRFKTQGTGLDSEYDQVIGDEISGEIVDTVATNNATINNETEVTDEVIVWIIVQKKTTTTNDLLISDEETITPPTPSKTPTTPDDTLDDDSAADTDDTPTPSDDDDIAPDDTDDTTDTPSDADDTDDADTDTDDTEPADDPTDEPDTDDGDVEDTDAAGDDVLDDEPDDVDADAETAPEPLDILVS